jgi:hypothetical protein
MLSMSLSLLSLLLLGLQVVLFGVTAFIAPFVVRPNLWRYLAYSALVALTWLAYAVAAMLFDGKTKNDVPGIAYLLHGFLGWLIGTVIFGVRAVRPRS